MLFFGLTLRMLKSSNSITRSLAIRRLGLSRDKKGVEPLLKVYEKVKEARPEVLSALIKIADPGTAWSIMHSFCYRSYTEREWEEYIRRFSSIPEGDFLAALRKSAQENLGRYGASDTAVKLIRETGWGFPSEADEIYYEIESGDFTMIETELAKPFAAASDGMIDALGRHLKHYVPDAKMYVTQEVEEYLASKKRGEKPRGISVRTTIEAELDYELRVRGDVWKKRYEERCKCAKLLGQIGSGRCAAVLVDGLSFARGYANDQIIEALTNVLRRDIRSISPDLLEQIARIDNPITSVTVRPGGAETPLGPIVSCDIEAQRSVDTSTIINFAREELARRSSQARHEELARPSSPVRHIESRSTRLGPG